jgi:hypothetical protein
MKIIYEFVMYGSTHAKYVLFGKVVVKLTLPERKTDGPVGTPHLRS